MVMWNVLLHSSGSTCGSGKCIAHAGGYYASESVRLRIEEDFLCC